MIKAEIITKMKVRNLMVVVGTNVGTALVCWLIFATSGSKPNFESNSDLNVTTAVDALSKGTSFENRPASTKVESRPQTQIEPEKDPNGSFGQSVSCVSESGALSSAIIEKYKLSPSQYQELQSAISRYWASMAKSAAERMVFDSAASSASPDGAEVYRLPAMSEEDRRKNEVDLAGSLRLIGGDEVSSEICNGMTKGSSFGYHGKYDIVFRFKPMVVKRKSLDGSITGTYIDESNMSANYDVFDPKSGAMVANGVSSTSELTSKYGNIFVVPTEGDGK